MFIQNWCHHNWIIMFAIVIGSLNNHHFIIIIIIIMSTSASSSRFGVGLMNRDTSSYRRLLSAFSRGPAKANPLITFIKSSSHQHQHQHNPVKADPMITIMKYPSLTASFCIFKLYLSFLLVFLLAFQLCFAGAISYYSWHSIQLVVVFVFFYWQLSFISYLFLYIGFVFPICICVSNLYLLIRSDITAGITYARLSVSNTLPGHWLKQTMTMKMILFGFWMRRLDIWWKPEGE